MSEEADAIEKAVEDVLNDGVRTADIAKKNESFVNTTEITEAILAKI